MESLAVISPPGGRRQARAAIELAGLLPRGAQRALIVDLDPLARATRLLGIDPGAGDSISDVLLRRRPLDAAVRRVAHAWDFVPATRMLAAFEAFAARDRELCGVLRAALAPLAGRYDYVLLLAPGESGEALWSAALEASDAVLVFAEPLSFGLRGVDRVVRQLHAPVHAPAQALNGRGPLALWIAALGFSARSPLTRNFLVGLRDRFPAHVLRTLVPDSDEVSHEMRQAAYHALAGELRGRLRPSRRPWSLPDSVRPHAVEHVRPPLPLASEAPAPSAF